MAKQEELAYSWNCAVLSPGAVECSTHWKCSHNFQSFGMQGKAEGTIAARKSSQSEFDDKENLKPDGHERMTCPLSPRRRPVKRQPLGEMDVINHEDEYASPKPSKIQKNASNLTPQRLRSSLPSKEPTIQSPLASLNAIDKVRKATPSAESPAKGLPPLCIPKRVSIESLDEKRVSNSKRSIHKKSNKDNGKSISSQPSCGGEIFSPRYAVIKVAKHSF